MESSKNRKRVLEKSFKKWYSNPGWKMSRWRKEEKEEEDSGENKN